MPPVFSRLAIMSLLLAGIFLPCLTGLSADITITISPPNLKPGWADVESLIADQATLMTGDLEALVVTALDKPLLLAAFTEAGSLSSLASSRMTMIPFDFLSISLGTGAGIRATPLDPVIIDSFSTMTSTDDINAGAAVQGINLQGGINFHPAIYGLEAGYSVSGFTMSNADLELSNIQAGAKIAWRFLRPAEIGHGTTWSGLRIEAGGSYSWNRLASTVELDPLSQNLAFDLDGSGPLVPLNVTMTVNPTVALGIETQTVGGMVQLGTGITLFDLLDLQIGFGGAVFNGSSSITMNLDEEVLISGYLSNLIEPGGNARLAITGDFSGTETVLAYPYVYAAIALRTGTFSIEIPVYYNFNDGLSASVLFGVQL